MSFSLDKDESEVQLTHKIEKLSKENRELKNNILSLSETEQNLQATISNIQQLHTEYQNSYNTLLSELRTKEKNLKNQFETYQSILEKKYSQNEQRLNDEIAQLKEDIKSKDDVIARLIKQNKKIKHIVTKNEIEWKLKEQEYENALILKENKLKEMDDVLTSISKETEEEMTQLSKQIEAFQNKFKNEEQEQEQELEQEQEQEQQDDGNGNAMSYQGDINEEYQDDGDIANNEEDMMEHRLKPYNG